MDTSLTQAIREALDFYRFPADAELTLLRESPWSRCFQVGATDSHVLRIDSQLRTTDVAAHATAVDRIRNRVRPLLPHYRLGSGGYSAYLESVSACTSAYQFIEGTSGQPFADWQFDSALDFLSDWVVACQDTRVSDLPLDDADALLLRDLSVARRVIDRFGDCCRIGQMLRSLDVGLGRLLSGSSFLHGDLNASNFLWRPDSTLAGVVDFASACRGSLLAEVLPFLTGTAFVDGVLRVDRLASIAHLLRQQLTMRLSARDIVDVACLVAIAFFGRVNARAADSVTVEWRDGRRALSIFDRRMELESAIGW
jgi:hypothetical protein